MLNPIESESLRSIMAEFATGVTVVTTRSENMIHGLTVNSFCSVSLAPPLVLVCIDKSAQSHDMIEQSGCFAVNILCEAQRDISIKFATASFSAEERFRGIVYRTEKTGAPIIDRTLGWLDCKVVAAHPGGDHTIFIGEVLALGSGVKDKPLLFFHSQYGRLMSD